MSSRKPNCNYKLLCETIKEKDKVTARDLILNNTSVNIPAARGNTPLHWAVLKFRDLDIVTMLLDKGANIHAKNRLCLKPLDVAIQNNRTKATQLLIKRGALVEEDLYTCILMAIEKNNDIIVEMLINHEIQNNPLTDLITFLNIAISRGQPKIIKHILPHLQFQTLSDQYIPREAVIKSGPQCKECVELLLEWKFIVDPNSKNDKDFIYGAVKNGYLPIVLQLLELGINANLVNSDEGLSLLKVACLNKHRDIVKCLLNHNASLNVKTPTNNEILNDLTHNSCDYLALLTDGKNDLRDITCLHIAVLNSDLKMTKLLLRHGATILDDPDFFNITKIAVQKNCEKIVRMFLERGVNVNNIDSEGKTLLHYCLLPSADEQDSRYNIAKLLLEKGADVHIQTASNKLLFKAIKNRHHKIAQLFLDYDADLQYISPNGNSLLHKAIGHYFDVEFIKTLLKLNLPVDARNKSMLTPLLVACKTNPTNQLEIIKVLLGYNANIHCTDNNLMTPLHFAYRVQNLKFVTILLQKGANINATNLKGRTPLHFACKYKTDLTQSLIQLLLKHNANIEAVDKKGWTPLFIACKTGNDSAVKCLLANHANANHTDCKNLNPLYIAAKNCKYNSEIVKILLQHKVNIHCIDKRGNSIIHVIVNQENIKLMKCLAKTQINFNSINRRGNTPLHIAVQRESVQMVKKLIKYGANVNIFDKNKQTPLKNAVDYMSDYRHNYEDYRERYCWWDTSSGNSSDNESWDTDNYENHIYPYKEIMKILKIQVVKLKAAGLKVNNQNLKIVYSLDDNETSDDESSSNSFTSSSSDGEDFKIDILQLEVECEQEIEKMRMKSISFNNITFHDLLIKHIHFLSKFVKNKKVQKFLESKNYDKKFPLYVDIVKNRFRDAIFRYRIMYSASKFFCQNICHQLSDNCINTVFSYLSTKDLKMFIRAMKLNKKLS